jgi:Kdo2-lipid IVA lauroyltransferase/acyltransferase
MAKVIHTLEYAAALTGVRIAQAMPARWADLFGGWLGSVTGWVLTSRRRIAYNNLKRAMGNELSDEQIRGIVENVFRNTGRTLVEFARFRKTRLEGIAAIVESSDFPELHAAMARGKGAIIVTAHFGNWEMMGAWVATQGYPMDFLIGTQHNAKVDELLVDFRRAIGVGVIRLSTSARSVFKALKANHVVGLVSDQHASSGGIRLTFFGRPAATPKGPALFAIRADCPLLPMMLHRERYDRHVVIKGPAIYPPNTGDEEQDIRLMTEEYTRFFERTIRQYPDQWLWTHRRWKLD